MDYSAQQVIQGEIEAQEELIWSGRPKLGIVFRLSDIFVIPFSLFWGGFAFFWEYMALTSANGVQESLGFDIIFPIFGIPFVLIGLYMIFGRFIYDKIRRDKTFYGVTDNRVIIVSGIIRRSVKSIEKGLMAEISLSEKRDGSGTILFGQESARGTWSFMSMENLFMPSRTGVPKFEWIENAKMVYKSIRGA